MDRRGHPTRVGDWAERKVGLRYLLVGTAAVAKDALLGPARRRRLHLMSETKGQVDLVGAKRPLVGKRIWVTRPRSRAQEIAAELRKRGAHAIVAATTCVQEASSEEAQALAVSLAEAKHYDWLVLTSANSVDACALALSTLGLDARAFAGLRIAVVGSATSAALARLGIRADLVASAGNGASLAKDLLASASASDLRVLLPRAAHGREEAIQLLQEAGCTVDVRTAYHTVNRPASAPDLAQALAELRTGSLDAVAFFAPSQVDALCAMDARALEYLAAVPILAAIGNTTAEALRSRGLTVHACAKQPTGSEMAIAITKAFAEA